MRYERAFKEAWTESAPAPLVMTDTEILDWMNEYSWVLREVGGVWHTDIGPGEVVVAPTVRSVICKAAAYLKEVNG